MDDSQKIHPQQAEGQGEPIYPTYRVEKTVQAQPVPQPMHRDIQAALDKIPAHIDALKALNSMMLLGAILEAAYPDFYMSTSLYAAEPLVIISMKFNAVPEAAGVLRYLAAVHNLHQKEKVWIYEADKSLNWKFPGMRLTGHFNQANAKCRFVQTGVKTEPVYEMRCDGMESLPDVAPKAIAAPAAVLEMPF